jgi:hypothetical protein
MSIDIKLSVFCERLLPRMLTQVCRDPGSPAYGSFDRNWWHYKIRDFSSIILQQGGYAVYCASQWTSMESDRDALRALAAGSCRFWNQRALKHGAFEEYYPWEQGYPPVAFSTLAVAKMVSAGVISKEEIFQGLEIATSQLLSRFESKATNQQVAGTSAVCWVRKIAPQLVDETAFQKLCSQTLACQHEEGWYMEYGGPDLGYLAVTMDCLWDAYDATGDERFRESAAKALEFIAPFTAMPHRGAGMFNARNTDYIVPYGIARFLNDEKLGDTARLVLGRILEELDDANHFLHAVDDRYFCHYIGHSLFRTVELLKTNAMDDLVENSQKTDRFFKGTGQWLRFETSSGCAALVGAKKGGILSLDFNGHRCVDYGWVVVKDGKEWVSHWWGDFWKISQSADSIEVSGQLTPHQENTSTPFKHMALRGLSLLFGRRIIGLLKEKMIFKEKQSDGIPFSRKITFLPDRVEVMDQIGVADMELPNRAPRSSKRHVASADSHHVEDLALCGDCFVVDEMRKKLDESVEIKTVYRRK